MLLLLVLSVCQPAVFTSGQERVVFCLFRPFQHVGTASVLQAFLPTGFRPAL